MGTVGVVGTVGRESGQTRLRVSPDTKEVTLGVRIESSTRPGSVRNTDEWGGHNRTTGIGREHKVVCRSEKEYARDDAGDRVRQARTSTCGGL